MVAPDAEGAAADPVVADDLGNGGVVVDHFQRPEAEITHIQGFGGKLPAALPALESTGERQLSRDLLRRTSPQTRYGRRGFALQ